MPSPTPRSPAAGGCLIALGIVAGVAIGLAFAQVSLGLLVGIGVGVTLALALHLTQRR